MGYLKSTATLIVDEDDAAAVVEQLNANLDRLEELHTAYGLRSVDRGDRDREARERRRDRSARLTGFRR